MARAAWTCAQMAAVLGRGVEIGVGLLALARPRRPRSAGSAPPSSSVFAARARKGVGAHSGHADARHGDAGAGPLDAHGDAHYGESRGRVRHLLVPVTFAGLFDAATWTATMISPGSSAVVKASRKNSLGRYGAVAVAPSEADAGFERQQCGGIIRRRDRHGRRCRRWCPRCAPACRRSGAAASPSSGHWPRITGELSISWWVAMAPMRTMPPDSAMSLRPGTRPRSITVSGRGEAQLHQRDEAHAAGEDLASPPSMQGKTSSSVAGA